MNFILLGVLIVAVTVSVAVKLPDIEDPKFKEHTTACANETGVSPNIVEEMKAWKVVDMDVLTNPKTKCFFKCMLLKHDLINDKAEPNYEKIKETFEIDDNFRTLQEVKACLKGSTSTDPCEKVFEVIWCVPV